MLNRICGAKGFTLLENILATLILGVGLTAGLMAMQNSTINTINGDLSTVATQLANEKLEVILADSEYLGYEYLDEGANYPVENLNGDYAGFTRTVSIVEVNSEDLMTPEAGSGLKKVQIEVGWGFQDFQRVTVSTLVADYSS